MYYVGNRPHVLKRRLYLEIFNEIVIMFGIYFMVIFSDFCTNNQFKYDFGYLFTFATILIIFVNLSNMGHKSI